MSDETTVPLTMPPAIAKAVVAVKKHVRQLGKDAENKFAHFNYVSVDRFYEALGPLMADAGLFVIVDEAEMRVEQIAGANGKPADWLTANYLLTLFHESGASYGPIRRLISIPCTGPQSFGIGLSYVEKYFLRGLFKVPTGDQDADAEPQGGVPVNYTKGGKAPPLALRSQALAILEPAAAKGQQALALAWKALSSDMQKAAVPDKERLKELAQQQEVTANA